MDVDIDIEDGYASIDLTFGSKDQEIPPPREHAIRTAHVITEASGQVVVIEGSRDT